MPSSVTKIRDVYLMYLYAIPGQIAATQRMTGGVVSLVINRYHLI